MGRSTYGGQGYLGKDIIVFMECKTGCLLIRIECLDKNWLSMKVRTQDKVHMDV